MAVHGVRLHVLACALAGTCMSVALGSCRNKRIVYGNGALALRLWAVSSVKSHDQRSERYYDQ